MDFCAKNLVNFVYQNQNLHNPVEYLLCFKPHHCGHPNLGGQFNTNYGNNGGGNGNSDNKTTMQVGGRILTVSSKAMDGNKTQYGNQFDQKNGYVMLDSPIAQLLISLEKGILN